MAISADAVAASPRGRRYLGTDYVRALQQYYPEALTAPHRVGTVDLWLNNLAVVGSAPDRFQPMTRRPWKSARDAYSVAGMGPIGHETARWNHKGLALLKTAVDLVLYANLVWELQPATVIEFGSFQGGSALWFADQMNTLYGGGNVHSFELMDKCVHPSARSPHTHFHHVDLLDLSTLDRALFSSLPHPWLVVDDAHVNVDNVMRHVAGFMQAGDYYVIEDMFRPLVLRPMANWMWRRTYAKDLPFSADKVMKVVAACESLPFLVDTNFTDAYGLNVTAAPNGWLVKTE